MTNQSRKSTTYSKETEKNSTSALQLNYTNWILSSNYKLSIQLDSHEWYVFVYEEGVDSYYWEIFDRETKKNKTIVYPLFVNQRLWNFEQTKVRVECSKVLILVGTTYSLWINPKRDRRMLIKI